MITLTLIPDHGDRFEVTAGTRDVYLWEKASKSGKTFAALQDNPSIVDMYEIAWFAARRQGLIPTDLTMIAFAEMYELGTDDKEDAEEEDAGPFPEAASPVTSSVSPSPPASRRTSGPRKAKGR